MYLGLACAPHQTHLSQPLPCRATTISPGPTIAQPDMLKDLFWTCIVLVSIFRTSGGRPGSPADPINLAFSNTQKFDCPHRKEGCVPWILTVVSTFVLWYLKSWQSASSEQDGAWSCDSGYGISPSQLCQLSKVPRFYIYYNYSIAALTPQLDITTGKHHHLHHQSLNTLQ